MEVRQTGAASDHLLLATSEASLVRGAEDLYLPTDAASLNPSATRARHDARGLFRRITAGIALSDAFSLLLAMLMVDSLFPAADRLVEGLGYHLVFAVAALGWVGVFTVFGLYAPRHLSAVEELRRVIGASSFAMVLLIMTGFWFETSIPRGAVGTLWALLLVFELLTRRMWRLEVARRRANGSLALRTLVIGTNEEARSIASQLAGEGSGYDTVGFVGTSATSVQPNGMAVVSGISKLARAINSDSVECIFVASSALRMDEMTQVMQIARQSGVDVRVSAHLPEILASRVAIQNVGEAMALSLKPLQLSGTQEIAKRGFDLLIAGLVLLVSAPVWLVIAAAIKATSKGPVFFRQTRVTKDGRHFKMVKFRTMSDDIDLESLGVDSSSPFFKLSDDPRITSVGRFLRKTSLDELPQLLNVITGGMSLVGPRPLPVEQVESNRKMLSGRLEVKAGMTGWWQIRGRSDVSPEAAVKLDVFYIENWSLALDLYILLKTFGVVLARSGAF